ncbi:hypothetical protein [Roseibium sp.]|uniref:hypothetical protein n=1 Tax=Roseibium sp. TaxID=1936156 RepID=UPI003A979651
MPRFPVYERNIKELGRILARAATDPEFKRRLMDDPAEELRRAGLPEATVQLFVFSVIDESSLDRPPVVLPFRLNETKLAAQDPEYLDQVASIVPAGHVN